MNTTAPNRKAGRKRVIAGQTEERLFRMLRFPFGKSSISRACRIAGIGRRTFYDECKRNREFLGKVREELHWRDQFQKF